MTDETARLHLPLLAEGQAQKHVTLNEALLKLDGVVHLAVRSRTELAQPSEPAAGERYILSAGRSGTAWTAAPDGAVATWRDGQWRFDSPTTGWTAYVEDEGRQVVFVAGCWRALGQRSPRELLVNGGFQIWQRGRAFTNVGGGLAPAYLCDRWALAQSGAASNQVTSVTEGSRSMLRVSRPAGSSSTGERRLLQVVADCPPGGAVTAQVKLRAGVDFSAVSVSVALVAGAQVGGSSADLVVDAWDDQQLVGLAAISPALSFDEMVTVGGVVPNEASCLALLICWSPVGVAGSADHLDIADAMLVTGADAIEFVRRPAAEVLSACERFFEKSYDLDTEPGAASGAGRRAQYTDTGGYVLNSRLGVGFRVRKARPPSVSIYSPGGGAPGYVGDVSGVSRAVNALSIGEAGFELQYLDATAASGVWFHYTAEAEL